MNTVPLESERLVARGSPPWLAPWIGAVAYPGFVLAFPWAMEGYRESGSLLWGICAWLAVLLAVSVPALALRALILMRHEERPTLVRGMLFLMFAIPSLFTLSVTVSRTAGVADYLVSIWVSAWLAVGAALLLRKPRDRVKVRTGAITRLRVIHGVAALFVLLGFLIAHLINHDLAAWSVELHGDTLRLLRLWYRSSWVEPVLLGLLLLMIGTGVPMVAHHSRGRSDVFRVIQMATGVYVGVFLCSHVIATLVARSGGVETDWFFAAGPTSLLDAKGLAARLIPHYFLGVLAVTTHVACGVRVILLQHGVTRVVADRAAYGLGVLGVAVTAVAMAALLGLHVE